MGTDLGAASVDATTTVSNIADQRITGRHGDGEQLWDVETDRGGAGGSPERRARSAPASLLWVGEAIAGARVVQRRAGRTSRSKSSMPEVS